MYIIATQGEGKEQKECVFAWTVLLRNVTQIPKGHHGWTPAKNRGQICVPAPTWTSQNCNISVNKGPILLFTVIPSQGSWTEDLAMLFSFLFLYTATKYKSTDVIYTTNRPVRNYWDSERNPGAEPLRCAQKTQSELVAYVLVFLSFINTQQTWNSIIC